MYVSALVRFCMTRLGFMLINKEIVVLLKRTARVRRSESTSNIVEERLMTETRQ